MRIATTLVAAVAAVSMAAPTPAQAGAPCYDKYTQKTCQDLEHLVCILLRRCF
jgi:hypothetical protein